MNKTVVPAVLGPEIPVETKQVKTTEPKLDEPLALKDSPESIPIDNYEKEEDQPYIVKYLGFNMPYYGAEEGTTRENLDGIDEFVKEQIKDSGYKPNITSYEKILKQTKKKLGIEEEATQENTLERIAGFVKAFNRIKENEEKDYRKDILKKLYLLAKDKDYDTEGLSLYLEEEYIKWLSNQ